MSDPLPVQEWLEKTVSVWLSDGKSVLGTLKRANELGILVLEGNAKDPTFIPTHAVIAIRRSDAKPGEASNLAIVSPPSF